MCHLKFDILVIWRNLLDFRVGQISSISTSHDRINSKAYVTLLFDTTYPKSTVYLTMRVSRIFFLRGGGFFFKDIKVNYYVKLRNLGPDLPPIPPRSAHVNRFVPSYVHECNSSNHTLKRLPTHLLITASLNIIIFFYLHLSPLPPPLFHKKKTWRMEHGIFSLVNWEIWIPSK